MNDGTITARARFVEPSHSDRLRAVSRPTQGRPIILVLGMHRSGTSLCSHILSALGVDMADKIPGPNNPSVTPDNPHGHWERWEIVKFHDRILDFFNRGYYGRFHDFALPVGWWADPRVVQIRREIVTFLEQRMGHGYFGFKDPRTVRLMPMWHQILSELNLSPKVVLCLRNPAQVARSLQARDGLDPEIGEYRWLVHVVDFFRYANSCEVCTIEYEGWFKDRAANLNKLRQFLNLTWHQSEADLELTLSEVIDPAARHDDPAHCEAHQPLVRSLHKLACRAGGDAAARDQIAAMVAQFVAFQQLQKPFLRVFEDVAFTAAKYDENEQELTALRAVVDQREAALGAAEAGLATAMAEIERQREQINELAGERTARIEIEAEAATLKVTLAEREDVIEELSRRADNITGSLQSVQTELAERTRASDRAEQEAHERNLAIEAFEDQTASLCEALMAAQSEAVGLREALAQAAQVAAMRDQIAALCESLEQAEQEDRRHAAIVATAQDEIAAMRRALVSAERQAEERSAAVAAMNAEIARLHDELARADRAKLEQAAASEVLEAQVAQLRNSVEEAERARQEGVAASAAMQTEVSTLTESLAVADEELRGRSAEAEAMQCQIAALRETVVRDTRERAIATAKMQGEISQLRDAVDKAERAAGEHTETTAEMKREIHRLQGALEDAERAIGERSDAAVAMQNEISGLRDALTKAATDAQCSEVKNLRAEIDNLREAVARAERAAQKRDAASQELLVELMAVRNQLAAARSVGRACLQSLRAEPMAVRETTTSAGWRTTMQRLVGFQPARQLP